MADLDHTEVPVASAPIVPAPRNNNESDAPEKRFRITKTGVIIAIVAAVIAILMPIYSQLNKVKHDVNSDTTPDQTTSQPQSQPVVAPPATLDLPTESISDSPETVVKNLLDIEIQAYKTGNITYLDHYFAGTNSSGYEASVGFIQRGNRFIGYKISGLNVSSIMPGEFDASYHYVAINPTGDGPDQLYNKHFKFIGDEWRVV